jgi:hypothetical protein
MGKDLYLILGATGALGSRIAAHLSADGRSTFLVGRRERPLRALAASLSHCVGTRVLDVTDASASTLLGDLHCIEADRLVIVETVIDKGSSRTMRASLAGATEIVKQLCYEARAVDRPVWIVAANSIAARACWPYTTSYAIAKRRQAIAYQRLGAPVAIVYLPILFGSGIPNPHLIDRMFSRYFDFDVYACSFDVAATLLSMLSIDPFPLSNNALEVGVLTLSCSLQELRGLSIVTSPTWLARMGAIPIALIGHTVLRADPAWQRLAAYACRYMSPIHLRRTRDHHQRPRPEELPNEGICIERDGVMIYLGDSCVADVRGLPKK